jgi:cytochrome b561
MENQKYHISARVMHWLMALIIISLLAVGFYMTNWLDKESASRMTIYGLHKSFGALVLFLVVIRIFIRFSFKIPPLPNSIPNLVQKFAHLVHILLYVLMIFMPLSGYLMSNSFGYPVHLFGLPLPMLVEKNVEMGKFFGEAHEFLGFAFVAILALHIAGVVKHRFFEKPENDVLKRMI